MIRVENIRKEFGKDAVALMILICRLRIPPLLHCWDRQGVVNQLH